MSKVNSANRFSEEVRARAVWLVLENEADYKSRSECVRSISSKIGCSAKTLVEWMRRQDIEEGNREGVTQSERAEMKELKREIKELRQANEILRRASAFFAAAELDRLGKR